MCEFSLFILCDQRTKRGGEELHHVQGQGQKLGGPYARRAGAKRSYPAPKVRGSGRECQAVTAQEWPRGATPSPRAGATAKKSHPTSEARGGGQEEQTHVQGVVAALSQEGLKKLSHVEGQEGRR